MTPPRLGCLCSTMLCFRRKTKSTWNLEIWPGIYGVYDIVLGLFWQFFSAWKFSLIVFFFFFHQDFCKSRNSPPVWQWGTGRLARQTRDLRGASTVLCLSGALSSTISESHIGCKRAGKLGDLFCSIILCRPHITPEWTGPNCSVLRKKSKRRLDIKAGCHYFKGSQISSGYTNLY